MGVCWWIKDFEGMSDLCLYKLEDNVWDEFGRSDDHIVPGDEYMDQFAFPGDSWKKQRHKVKGTGTTDDTANCGFQGKNGNGLLPLTKKEAMLEKGSWSHSPDDVFLASRENQQTNEATSMSSDAGVSGQAYKSRNIDSVSKEFCSDKCTDLDNNLYRLPQNNLSQTDNDLSFLDNDYENKESSELLYYNLPEIGNFEDIDRMFRSCDSTFGLGNLSNEDDLSWFTASHAAEGFGDPLKSSPEFINVSKHCEDFNPSRQSSSFRGCNPKGVFLDKKTSFQNLGQMSFTNEETKLNIEDDDSDNAQNNSRKMQPLHQNKLGAKREDLHQESSGSLHQQGDLKQFVDVKHAFRNSLHHAFPSGDHQHEQNMGDSFRYMQTHVPYMDLDYSNPSDHVSGTTSQKNDYPSATLKESSYGSNRMDMSNGPLSETPTTNHRGHRLYKNQVRARSSKVTAQKQALQLEHDMEEDHNEVEGGSMCFPTELDSSNAPESSCMSSVLNDISLEAASFRQLQQVTEKLELRTKLCIRDSLYRLAKSAEQGHNYANPNGNARDGRGTLMVGEPNNVLIDIETNTNPIDRSIARLLFHRPSDRTVTPTDSSPLKSHAMVPEPVTSLTEVAEEKACLYQEETDVSTEQNVASKRTRKLVSAWLM